MKHLSFIVAWILWSCKTPAPQSSGLREAGDVAYVQQLTAENVARFAIKRNNEVGGRNFVYYNVIFLVEFGDESEKRVFFQNSTRLPADTVSYHSKLIEEIPEYRGVPYFSAITPGPNKRLSSGYMYVKVGADGIAAPVGFELVLLENGSNLRDPEQIMARGAEIKYVADRLNATISFTDQIHYTSGSADPASAQQMATEFPNRVGVPFAKIESIIGTRNPVLTAGTSYGYLRQLSLEEFEAGRYTFKDIILADRLPLEISPLSGLISSVPQTPLSHVVLKTKQLGVPNIFIEEPRSVRKIAEFLDQPDGRNLIELTVREDGTYRIRGGGSQSDGNMPSVLLRGRARRFWDRLRPQNPPPLNPDLATETILVWRGRELDRQFTTAYGAKGTHFALLDNDLMGRGVAERHLYDKSFLIPFFYYQKHVSQTISANLCQEVTEECSEDIASGCANAANLCDRLASQNQSIQAFIDSFLSDEMEPNRADFDERRSFLLFIRTLIEEAPIDATTTSRIRSFLAAYPENRRMRMRSSTNAEDLPGNNGAGLYVSKSACLGDDDNDSDRSRCRTDVEVARLQRLIAELESSPGDHTKLIRKLSKKIKKKYKLSKNLPKVFASLWNDIAFNDREFYRIDHKKVKMGVLVHPSFIDESANGVAVVESQSDGRIFVTVSAQVEDISVTNPDVPGAVAEQLTFEYQNGGGVENLSYKQSSNRAEGRVLSPSQIASLAEQMWHVHRLQEATLQESFTGKTDLEFIFDAQKKLLIKQARPL